MDDRVRSPRGLHPRYRSRRFWGRFNGEAGVLPGIIGVVGISMSEDHAGTGLWRPPPRPSFRQPHFRSEWPFASSLRCARLLRLSEKLNARNG
jgi:hypothetical protein